MSLVDRLETTSVRRAATLACLAFAALVAALYGLGCEGAGGETTPDAGATDTGAPVPPSWMPAEPSSAELPSLGPCPEGWTERAHDGSVTTCEPFGESGPFDCAAHEAHFPGDADCTPVGAACPASGDFPEVPPDRDVVYALAGATGGDGSLAAPFGSIREAVSAASAGTVVAIGRGTYAEELTVPPGIELWGACTEATVLTSVTPATSAGTVNVRGGGAVLRNLRIEVGLRAGIWAAGAAATVELEGVVVDGTARVGIQALDGASITGRNVVVRNTTTGGAAGFGQGINADERASVTLGRVAIERTAGTAVFLYGAGTTVHLEDAVVRDSGGWGINAQEGATAEILRSLILRPRGVGAIADGPGATVHLESVVVRSPQGRGLNAQRGGHATGLRTLVEDGEEAAARTNGDRSQLELTDVVIRDTRPDPSGQSGRALVVTLGSRATVSRLLVERAIEDALFVAGAGAMLTAEDVVVRDTESRPSDGTHGRCLQMQDAGRATFTRLELERCREAAVIVLGEATTLQATDLLVRDTLARPLDDRFGRGLSVEYGASADIRRARLSHNLDAAVFVDQPGSHLQLEDVVVSDTGSDRSTRTRGRGIEIVRGARAGMVRVIVERSRDVGVMLGEDASLTVDRISIRDTATNESDGAGGRGLNAQIRSIVDGAHVEIASSHEVGLLAAGHGTRVQLDEVQILDTATNDCTTPACASFGMGLGVYQNAVVEITGFEISGSALCGVHLVDAALDLRRGTVSNGEIGVCLHDPAYDLSRLQEDVIYRDNGINLDTTSLPVPDPAVPGTE